MIHSILVQRERRKVPLPVIVNLECRSRLELLLNAGNLIPWGQGESTVHRAVLAGVGSLGRWDREVSPVRRAVPASVVSLVRWGREGSPVRWGGEESRVRRDVPVSVGNLVRRESQELRGLREPPDQWGQEENPVPAGRRGLPANRKKA